MYSAIASNKRKTVLMMAGFVLLVAAIGGAFAWSLQDYWILVWVMTFAVIYAGFQYFASGSLAIATTGAKQVDRKSNPRLYRIVENLAIATGLPMPEVYIIEDPALNAFATGRNPKHAKVAATTGLLDAMNDREVTAVMAHEMSHVQNYDIRLSTIVFGLVMVIGLLADFGVRIAFFAGDRDNRSPFGLVLMILTAILAPLVATLTQMAVSRNREYLADASAALMTRDPEGMIKALEVLKEKARPMKRQSTATASLFISNPMKEKKMAGLFSTHPPLDKRIERLRKSEKTF
ncbi:M48 family metalloprotease [Candidatus Saccharibacteria bacterium]|nr:M48 family metalloprotease [Candidatus Saccharibacteria bacterium]